MTATADPPRLSDVNSNSETNAEQGEHQVLRDYIKFGFLKAYDRRVDIVDECAYCITTRPVVQTANVPA